jgi:N-methylhydantoinase A/oxoprolinase/acetone carboxylase beta subunit
MRLSADVGGTFTDLVVETGEGSFRLFKAPTTSHDPVVGMLDAIDRASVAFGTTTRRPVRRTPCSRAARREPRY